MIARFHRMSLRARLAYSFGTVAAAMLAANLARGLAPQLAAALLGAIGALAVAALLLRLQRGRHELAALNESLSELAGRLQAAQDPQRGQHADLVRTNRILRMVSRCHEVMLRARDPEELTATVCRTLSEEGGYPLVWTGASASANGGEMLANAIYGTAEARFAAAAAGWLHGGRGSAMAIEALRGSAPCLLRGAPGEYGFPSSLALPLCCGDAGAPAIGVLCLYSGDPEAFGEEELTQLQNLANGLAFSLDGMRKARQRRAAEQVLAYQANHDAATGLANRTLFNDRLQQAMAAAERSGRKVAVLAVTMDRYRGVKTSLGADACNALLMHAASAVQSCLREGDTLARLLGNEFAVIVTDMLNDEDVLPLANKLLAAVKAPMRWRNNIVTTTASIGIALMSKDGGDAPGLLRSANAAMAQAHGLGGNRFRFHALETNDRVSRMFAMEAELRRALMNNELVLYYQPRAAMQDGCLSGAEALVRWQHPTRGLIAPGEFLSLAESTGLVVPLGAWVIREVCRQQRAWCDAGLPLVPVAMNLSPRQFHEEGLAELAEMALAENDVPPAMLGFEVTEAVVMENIGEAVARLTELKQVGVKLSLDGFGTGHSSLARLRELPLDYLKIDRSFVRQLGSEQADEAVCRAIIDLGHNLNMHVVAEGVETLLQREWLRAHRCDEIQGYFYARPMPPEAFARLLAADRPRSNTMLPLWRVINYKG